jgi:AcrR family transcriptional regulator
MRNKKEALMNRRDKQKMETLGDILHSAEILFAQQGYENTTINQIATHCGVTKGAFYHHFKSKDDVLERMCHDHYDALISAVLPIVDDKTKPAFTRIKEVIAASRNLALNRSGFVSEFLKVRKEEGNLILKERLQKYDRKMYIRIVGPLLAEAQEEGACSFQSSPEILAVFIHQLDRTVTEEIQHIMLEEAASSREEKIRAVLEGFAYTLKQLLNISEETVKIFLDIEAAMHYFNTLIYSPEETQ